MKALFTIAATIFTLTVTSAAQAQSSYEVLASNRAIKTAQIDRIINISKPILWPEVGTTGSVSIDKNLKIVNFSLNHRDLQNPTFQTPLIQTQLRLTRITQDTSCNITVYLAETVAGSNSPYIDTLTIVDNTKNTCPTFRPLAETEIRLERASRGVVMINYSVDMTASALNRGSGEVELLLE